MLLNKVKIQIKKITQNLGRIKAVPRKEWGFTLVELIVATGLFIVVSLVALGSLLNIIDANRKTHSTEEILNNLNFAVESMSKSMRVGSTYHCSTNGLNPPPVPANLDEPQDCAGGGTLIAYESSSGDKDNSDDQVVYRLNGSRLERSIDGGDNFVGVTAPEIELTEDSGLKFYVLGSSPSDNIQPRVIIVLSGTAGETERTSTDFNIQTSISQRRFDE